MAGLAAALDVPTAIEALAVALAPRGADGAVCRLKGQGGRTSLEVAVRAVIPAIARVVDGEDTVAAFAVDGVASITALDTGYAEHGPAGLIAGDEPYAVVVADTEREALVLARSGAGPGLYYAAHGEGWLVASEPGALLAAGVPATPDVDVVRRFIATGACDDTEQTFVQGIVRVRPGEAVLLRRGAGPRSHRAIRVPRARSAPAALSDAVSGGRVGVLLGPGAAGAAVLGTALSRTDRRRPLPVHTATFTTLDGPASHTPAVLVPLPHGSVRHIPHQLDPFDLDLDAFLRDMGEPVPDLGLYALWAVARDPGGGIDTLVDSSTGEPDCVARVSDRVTARYGVTVRCPLRGPDIDVDGDAAAIVGRTLDPAVARYAMRDSARPVRAAEIVLRLRDSVAAALATPRPWADRAGAIEALQRLHAGEPVDADALLRAYIVERWLQTVTADISPSWETPARRGVERPHDVVVGDATWARVPVRTRAFAPGDRLAAKVAWHVGALLPELGSLRAPWFVAVAGKAVAVTQRRVRPLWEIRPGPAARVLARLARRGLPRLAQAWTMQVAIDDGGLVRVAAATVASCLGRDAWCERLLPPDAAGLYPPRADAVPPTDAAVVRSPFRPDAAAEALLEALRYSLPPDAVESLAGCAVVSADDVGSRVLGFAPGPGAGAFGDPEGLIADVCVDNPAGQGTQTTPVLLILTAPTSREDHEVRREASFSSTSARRPS